MKKDDLMDINVFSQWLRILVTCSCVSNVEACLEVLDQAIHLIHTYPPQLNSNVNSQSNANSDQDFYPIQEINWLLIKSWNITYQFQSVQDMESVKKWKERTLKLCQALPNSQKASEVRS